MVQGTISSAFADQVRRDPNAIAVIAGGSTLSYRALDDLAGRLARQIAAFGAGPEDIVALAFPRSAALIVAMLAVAKAGAAYLALDVKQPQVRSDFFLRDSGARLLLAPAAGDADWGGRPTIMVDPVTCTADSAAGIEIETQARPDNLALAIYTSGSTGTPKAVVIEHASMIAQTCPSVAIPLGPGRRMLNMGSPAFDVTGLEIWGALLNGATAVVATDDVVSAEDIAALIETNRIDTAWFTAGLFRTLADTCPSLFRHLRVVASGGDVVSPAAARAVREAAPDVAIINGYGPAEATILACRHVVQPCDLIADRIPIGRALPGYELFILDDAMAPVAGDAIGEIYIAGAGVARGYHGRPELTAERFLPCPFGPPGGRMYRTGDLARWNADGTIDFQGRIDFQIKLRGFRIEAGEVEAALLTAPSVRQAFVTGREVAGDKRLAAYLVAADPAAVIDLHAVRAMLQEMLPEYMVPSDFAVVDTLPLTANGKVDRSALPDPAPPKVQSGAPLSPAEAMICQLFARLLGRPDVGRDDNFFDLGGSSLVAMRLSTALAQQTGAPFPVRSLFLTPTPASIARGLAERDVWSPLVPLQTSGKLPPLFCVHPASGVAIAFMTLARALGQDQPVWGLQARGLDFPDDPHRSIAAMAAAYCTAVRGIQPSGPYHLAGWSMGGIVAHEMACQLEAAGETVARIVMLDAGMAEFAADDPMGEIRFSIRILSRMAEKNAKGQARRAEIMAAMAARRHLMPPGTPPDWAERMLRQIRGVEPLVLHHRPSVCRTDIVLFRASGDAAMNKDEAFMWERYCTGTVRRTDLACRHNLILEPEMASQIAAVIRA